MGKKRIIAKSGGEVDASVKRENTPKVKRLVASGVVYIQSTFNNTRLLLSDHAGNALVAASSGSLGFKGAKKGTPFAASRVADSIAQSAQGMGVREVAIVIKGVGSGRESALRTLASRGLEISSIRDVTPVPHNGPRPKKARRV